MPSASIVVLVPFTGASRSGRQGVMTTFIQIRYKITYLNHATFNNHSNTCRSCIFHLVNIVCPFASIDSGVWHVSWNYEWLQKR